MGRARLQPPSHPASSKNQGCHPTGHRLAEWVLGLYKIKGLSALFKCHIIEALDGDLKPAVSVDVFENCEQCVATLEEVARCGGRGGFVPDRPS